MISIKSQLAGAVTGGVLGVATMAGFIAPAAAQAAAATAGPHTNIVGSPAKWMPSKLTVKPVSGKCSATHNSFTGTNKTKKPQTVLVMGKAVTTVKPGQTKDVCIPPSAAGATIKASLKSSGKVLTIKVK